MTDMKQWEDLWLWDQPEIGAHFLGKTFTSIRKGEYDGNDCLIFEGDESYMLGHDQNCCESFSLDDVAGDLSDLEDAPITMAEMVTERKETEWGYVTWTFYKFATIKGYVTLRWLGESNGYYSESVDLFKEVSA